MKPFNKLRKTLLTHKKLLLIKAPYQIFFNDFLISNKFNDFSIKSNKYFFKLAFGNFFFKFPMKLCFYPTLTSLKQSQILLFYDKILIKNFQNFIFLSFNLFSVHSSVAVLKIFMRLLGALKILRFFFQCCFFKNSIK